MLILKARKNVTLKLSEEQRDILLGCILGDGYITERGQIQVEQSALQRDYVLWKYEKLQSVSYGLPKQVIRIDRRNGQSTIAYRFWTRQFFRSWRKQFYPDGKKIFPNNLEVLSPISMAVWYMDDGHLMEKRRILLSTEGFDPESRSRIQEALLRSFGIRSSVKANGKTLIGTKNTKLFIERIKSFIVPSMTYKVP